MLIILCRFIYHAVNQSLSLIFRERRQLVTEGGLVKAEPVHRIPTGESLQSHPWQLHHHNICQLKQCQRKLLQERESRQNTERQLKETRNELIHSAKMAAIGRSFASLAHEINQPLTALSAYIFSTQRALEHNDMETAASLLRKSSLLVERTARIVQRLSHFSRKMDDTLPVKAVNVIECLQEAWNLLEIIHRNKQPILAVPQLPLYVMADEILLQQVFVNILSNALEAVVQDTPCIRVAIESSDDNVLLFISDNGPGWPGDRSAETLQPFYT
ncbi:MAG: ATP-binding protein [Enterobacteriaceae bacterium]